MFKVIIFSMLFINGTYPMERRTDSMERRMCSKEDNRKPSKDSRVGRLTNGKKSCTLTLISPNCAISAGSCGKELDFAEFNLPTLRYQKDGGGHSSRDVYRIDLSVVVSSINQGDGKDFAVMRLEENAVTGLSAGEANGYYDISYTAPRANSTLSVTGFGMDPKGNYSQRTAMGKLLKSSSKNNIIIHDVITGAGSKGAAIILEERGEIVGIHTSSRCEGSRNNTGTLISGNEKLQHAIKSCLELDKR